MLAPEYEGHDTHVVKMRRLIPRNINGWIDYDNPHLILPVLYRFLRFVEVENFRRRQEPKYRQLRSFSLLPYKKRVCVFILQDGQDWTAHPSQKDWDAGTAAAYTGAWRSNLE